MQITLQIPKLWLCFITQDKEKDVEEMTRCFDYFDGIVAVDGGSKDKTVEILESRKKAGKIVHRKWTGDHDMQMSEFLRAGVMKTGDYYVVLDSQERIHPEWLKTLRQDIVAYGANNVGCLLWGKPFLVRYFSDQMYLANPHCMPWPIRGEIVDVQDESQVIWDIPNSTVTLGKYIINKKNMDDTNILHGIKYMLYPRSNQVEMFYGRYGKDIVRKHEEQRVRFIWYLESKGYDLTLEGLEKYFRDGVFSPEEDSYIEFEFSFKDFFRFKILNQSRQEILKNRYNWSWIRYKNYKEIKQDSNNFIGQKNVYNRQFGFQTE